MIGGAAGDDHHPADLPQPLLGDTDVGHWPVPIEPARERVCDGGSLLVDLLEHERLKATLLGRVVVPVDLHRGHQHQPRKHQEACSTRAEHRNLSLAEHLNPPGMT